MPAKPSLRLVVPNTENRAVGPIRRANSAYRTREYLTEREVEALLDVAKQNRHGHRDSTMILVAYRHGFRASEVCGLMAVVSPTDPADHVAQDAFGMIGRDASAAHQ